MRSYLRILSISPLQPRNMSNFYAEGIDLKVSEKYRVPPRIAVPRDVVAQVSGDHYSQLQSETEYDFNLERNVIRKIEEWKRVHDQNEHVRHEQLRAWDRERRQLIEQEQKHLLNQVSYPSTADLSSSDDEGKNDVGERRGRRQEDESSVTAGNTTSSNTIEAATGVQNGSHKEEKPSVKVNPSVNRDFSTILQPTVVPESSGMRSFQLPDSFQGSQGINKVSQRGDQVTALNYSDWESDNYSPFDRMELKSINDLDILAQVLRTTQLNSNNNNQPEDPPPSPPSSSPVELPPKSNCDEGVPPSGDGEVSSENYSWNQNPIENTSEASSNQTKVDQPAPTATINTFPTFSHQQPPVQDYAHQVVVNGYYNNHNNNNTNHPHQYQSNIPPSYNYSSYSAANFHYSQLNTQHQVIASQENGSEEKGSGSNSLLRSRSKSVPDIVNELEEEVKASEQRRRVRNHSQCNRVEDHEEDDDADDTFERLPRESKELAMRISRMGFPINLVATVIEQLGNDDKKVRINIYQQYPGDLLYNTIPLLQIIEHLIPLNELLDLGFGISPTSEALLKFNNNRERALDFLIS